MNETNPKHLLVIDDDPDIQDLVSNFFQPKGYKVTCLPDAESALYQLNQNLKPDAIITDLQLPKMSGMDMIQKLKSLESDTPIIVMTVTRSVEVAMKAIRLGAYDFIVKPINFSQMQVSVDRAIHLKGLQEDNDSLRTIIKEKETQTTPGIIGKSPNFVKALDLAKRVAKSSANVFITGESGTGKEVVAKLIHGTSPRKKGPFVAINCSAIPENLLESELFGHAKGSFTGAIEKKLGLFEEAEDGTIFLDEIGDLSLPLQAKLLRVLQERKIKRVGENQARAINCRVISATHRNLMGEVQSGRFREDLFFRLNVIPIHVPPLRERKEDVLPLAEYFLKKFSALNESPARSFSKEALQLLMERPWKGNVRELENTVERAVVLSAGEVVNKSDLLVEDQSFTAPPEEGSEFQTEQGFPLTTDGKLLTLQELTQKYIEFALTRNSGAKDKTARELGIDRKTLYRRVQQQQAIEAETH